MKIEHYQDGDSDFTFEVTMRVGAEDGGSSTVAFGNIIFYIDVLTDDKSYAVFEAKTGDKISDDLPSKTDAINWIIEYVGGTLND